MSKVFAIEMGTKVADKITGFAGVVTGRTEYSTGCRQYLVQPRAKDPGEYPKATWLDEDRLISKLTDQKIPLGGPQSNPAPVK